jgi:hypothetical protein
MQKFHVPNTRKFHELLHILDRAVNLGNLSSLSSEHGERQHRLAKRLQFHTTNNGPQGEAILRQVAVILLCNCYGWRFTGKERPEPAACPVVRKPGPGYSTVQGIRSLPENYFSSGEDRPQLLAGEVPTSWKLKSEVVKAFNYFVHMHGRLDFVQLTNKTWAPSRAVLRNHVLLMRPLMCDTRLRADSEHRDVVELNFEVHQPGNHTPPYWDMMEVEFIVTYNATNGGAAPHPTFDESLGIATGKAEGRVVDFIIGRRLGPPLTDTSHKLLQQRQWVLTPQNTPVYVCAALSQIRRKVWALPVCPPGKVIRSKKVWEYDRFSLVDFSPAPLQAAAAAGAGAAAAGAGGGAGAGAGGP